MTLELAESPKNEIKVEYKKIFNPENPKQFLMVRSDVYANLERSANDGSMHSFFSKLWKGAVGLVKGAIAVAGGGGGGGSTGQPVTVNIPPYVPAPPIMQPSTTTGIDIKKILPFAIGGIALLVLLKKK